MSGHKVPIQDKSSANVEPAPKVWVEVNGRGVLCEFNKPTQVAGQTVKVTGFVRSQDRPITGPPYKYAVEYTREPKQSRAKAKTVTLQVRAMNKEAAKTIFWRQVETLLDGYYITIKSIDILK